MSSELMLQVSKGDNGKYRYLILEDHSPQAGTPYWFETKEDAIKAGEEYADILFNKLSDIRRDALKKIVENKR